MGIEPIYVCLKGRVSLQKHNGTYIWHSMRNLHPLDLLIENQAIIFFMLWNINWITVWESDPGGQRSKRCWDANNPPVNKIGAGLSRHVLFVN